MNNSKNNETATFTLTSNGIVIGWDAVAVQFTGYSLSEIIGKPFSTIQSIENIRRKRSAELLKLANSVGRAAYADWHVNKDGSHFWADLTISHVANAQNGAVAYSIEMRLSSPTNHVAESLRLRNDDLEKLLGHRTAELKERTTQLTAKTDQFNTSEALNVSLEGQLDERTVQLGERTAQLGVSSGQLDIRTGELKTRTNERDSQTTELGVRTDERDSQTTQLDQRTIQLSTKTRELDTVEALNKKLDALNQELEAFTYAASHDLRAPLRSIDGFSLVLIEDYGDKLDAEGQGHLKRIRTCAQRMGQLIDDLIGLSALTRATLKLGPCDLSAEARSIATELQRAHPERLVTFDFPETLAVSCDVRLMRIVLENLLGNAFKYTSKIPHAKIDVGTLQGDKDAVYFIRDNGAGFDMKYVHKLFGPFQRLHSSTEFEGNGIGLATVKRIINRHGGQVWVEGEIDKGTSVFFTL